MRKRTERAGVTRQTLAEQIVDYVRDRIGEEVFKPGQKLTIQSIAEELNVSMTPVREAFKTLAALGLVDMVPNRGVVVAKLGADEASQMLTVYSRLDMLGGELAALNAVKEDVARLRALVAKMIKAVENNDQITYFHTNQEFHSTLVRISRNPTLIGSPRQSECTALQHSLPRHARAQLGRLEKVALEHTEIVDAVEKHDAERAADLLKVHFKGAWQGLRRSAEPLREADPVDIPQADAIAT